MKKILTFSIILGVILITTGIVVAGTKKGGDEEAEMCTTIQDGTLLASDGNLITTGFDELGI